MSTTVSSVSDYLNSIPKDRRESIEEVRQVILNNLNDGFEEVFQYGMISYIIPLAKYPDTYNKQPLVLASLGNQKNHMAIYMNNIYSDPELNEWFVNAYRETGKKLDMGKSCVRFKKLDHLPLEIVGEAIRRTDVDKFINIYEAVKGKKKS